MRPQSQGPADPPATTVTTSIRATVWGAAWTLLLACQPAAASAMPSVARDDMAIRAPRPADVRFFSCTPSWGHRRRGGRLSSPVRPRDARCTISVLLTWLRVTCWVGAGVTPRTLAGLGGRSGLGGNCPGRQPGAPSALGSMRRWIVVPWFWVVGSSISLRCGCVARARQRQVIVGRCLVLKGLRVGYRNKAPKPDVR